MTAINVVRPPREVCKTDCTILYRFVQQPSSKFVPKNSLEISAEAVVLFLGFCTEISVALLLNFRAQISASNFVLNVAALFLDFCASLSWKSCLSLLLHGFFALIFVPINAAVPFVESPHYCPISSHYFEKYP